jgi:hypothetical protein
MGQSRDLSVMILRRISHSLFPAQQMASWPRAHDNFLTLELSTMELWRDGTLARWNLA